jgi:hypothetical protein
VHSFRDALIEPSLQTNWPAAQCDIPPLRPEQGVLPAQASRLESPANSIIDHSMTLDRP